MPARSKASKSLKIAGTSVPRVDGAEKATGAAVYTGDVDLPGMGYAKILRSPLPHARIVNVDARKAENLPVVWTVRARADHGECNALYAAIYKVRSIVAAQKVRYAGDSVAAVLAAAQMTAEEALTLIDFEYEELPAMTEIEEALAEGA